jgi:hypothetical protein
MFQLDVGRLRCSPPGDFQSTAFDQFSALGSQEVVQHF